MKKTLRGEMMGTENTRFKTGRILKLYTDLMSGETVSKNDAVKNYEVTARTVQRDIDDIRSFLDGEAAKGNRCGSIVHDKKLGGYVMKHDSDSRLTDGEIFALCKLLLKSDIICRNELVKIMEKLLESCASKENKNAIREIVTADIDDFGKNDYDCFIVEKLWDFSRAVKEKRYANIKYLKDGSTFSKRIKPMEILVEDKVIFVIDNGNGVSKTELYRLDCIYEYKISETVYER